MLFLLACASASLEQPALSRKRLGFVRFTEVPTIGHLRALDVSTLGMGWDGAAFLGWQRSQYVFARPEACEVLIVIRSGVEADHVRSILQTLEGQEPCIADFSRSLSPSRLPAG